MTGSACERQEPTPLDPYITWAQCTRFRDYALDPRAGRLAVAIECRDGVEALRRAVSAAGLQDAVAIPALYSPAKADAGAPRFESMFCTARVRPHALSALLPLVKRMELGTIVGSPAGDAVAGDVVVRHPAWRPSVVIGVIDDFVAFAHPRFASGGHSRIRYVWSQDAEPPRQTPQWRRPADTGYGHELTSLAASAGARKPSLETLHAAYSTVLQRATHGTHVADMAAATDRFDESIASNKLPDIIAVHFPKRMVADTSGGALSVQVLDGLRYIMHRAGEQASVVVNASCATLGGPHDGTSILECAIDELIDVRRGQLAVVIPAGNAYEDRCHAQIDFGPGRRERTLQWVIPPDSAAPAFMEVWLPEGAAHRVGIEVRDPCGRQVSAPSPTGPRFDNDADPAQATCGVIYWERVANGTTGTMILVAVAATTSTGTTAVTAAHGVWQVSLVDRGQGELPGLRVWVERNDTAHGQPPRGRQSYLLDPLYIRSGERPGAASDNPLATVQRHGALNTLATGRNTIVAGGFIDGTRPELAHYSGGGPARGTLRRPDVVTPSEESRTLHGLRGGAVEGVDSVRINGTSVAAPQITRFVAQQMMNRSRGTTLPNDIRTALRAAATRVPRADSPGHAIDPLRGEDVQVDLSKK